MKNVVIIAGGKSIREEWLNNGLFDNINGHTIWSLNYAYKTMPYLPNRELWVDRDDFFTMYKDDLFDMKEKGVELVTQRAGFTCGKNYEDKFTKLFTKTKSYTEYLNNTHLVYTGRYSLTGAFALSIAIKEEYDNIFLLGYDFGTPHISDGDTHYYQGFISHNSDGVNNPKVYRHISNKLNERITDFKSYLNSKSNIYNVSLISNIPYLDKISYERMYELLNIVRN